MSIELKTEQDWKKAVNEVKDRVKKLSNSVNNQKTPPLASAERYVAMITAYTSLMEQKQKKSWRRRHADVSLEQKAAMEYTGLAIEAMREYEMNFAIEMSWINFYNAMKPYVTPFFAGLDNLAKKEGMTKLLEEFVFKYDEDSDNKDGSLVVRAFNILSNAYGSDHAFEFAIKKTVPRLNEILGKMTKDRVAQELRSISDRIQFYGDETNDSQKYIDSMYCIMHELCGMTDGLDFYAINYHLSDAENTIKRIKTNRLAIKQDIRSNTSWFFDAAAGILENMDEKEYEALKKMASDYIKELPD